MPRKEKPYKSQMHEIKPGVYRGHAPKNQTITQQAAQAAEDLKKARLADETTATLRRNSHKTIF